VPSQNLLAALGVLGGKPLKRGAADSVGAEPYWLLFSIMAKEMIEKNL